MRRRSTHTQKIYLTALLEQLKPSMSTASPHLQKLQEAPLVVQVPLKHYRLAQDIYNTLHIGTGVRIDVNIWKFTSSDDMDAFVDSLILLGVPERVINYPASFVAQAQSENGSDESTDSDVEGLERDLEAGEEPTMDFDAGFESEEGMPEDVTSDNEDGTEPDEELNDLEDSLNSFDNSTTFSTEEELDDLELELQDSDVTEDEEDLFSELDDELAELEQELNNEEEEIVNG